MTSSIIELDLHGCDTRQARAKIDAQLKKAGRGVTRIRVIHGYNGGTALRDFVRKAYRSHPKLLRVEFGLNAGETDLVLREI